MSDFDVVALRRAEFPGLDECAFLNAASFTPLPERSRAAMRAYDERRSRIHQMTDDDFVGVLARSRQAAARLIGADAGEIALGWNTSFGINLAALSLPVRPDGTVVVSDREFPANVYPWMGREGMRLEVVPTDAAGRPDEARLLERLDRGDVSVFALSSVQFATGYRADLEMFGRFCREREIFFVVDAIQSLGQLPLDVRAAQVDVLAAGAHKWLCAPFGTGFAYVRREIIERMEPAVVGWTGMRASSDVESIVDYSWEFRRDARRFEVSTLPFHDFAGFGESLGLLVEVGVERIAEHLERILAPLVEWLLEHPEVELVSDWSPGRRSGILAFRPPAPEAAYRRLTASGVLCALREGSIRVAPHLYNTRAEVERVIDSLETSRKSGWT